MQLLLSVPRVRSRIISNTLPSGCFKDITDLGADGSQISRPKQHPKENDVKSDFMKRDYQKDKNGIIRFNSTPTVVQPQREPVMKEGEEDEILRNEVETPLR